MPAPQKYLQHVISMLQSAMQLSVQQQQQEDAADYNNLLRHGEGVGSGGRCGCLWSGGAAARLHQLCSSKRARGLRFLYGGHPDRLLARLVCRPGRSPQASSRRGRACSTA